MEPQVAPDVHEPPSGDEMAEDQKNPWMIDKIVETILSFMSFQELRNVRLVNSISNAIASPLMEPHCKELPFGRFFRRNLGFVQHYGLADMRRLTALLSTSWNFPCREFDVNTNFCGHHEPVNDHLKQEVVTAFFQTVSPFVKKLTLCDFFAEIADISPLLFPEGPPSEDFQYPALEYLCVNLDEQGHLDFAASVARNAPRVVDLEFGDTVRLDLEPYFTYVLEQMPNCANLQKLSIRGGLRDEHLIRLLHLGINNLRDLHIILGRPDSLSLTRGAMAHFLEMQGHVLTNLSVLVGANLERPFFVEVPQLPNLRYLQVLSLNRSLRFEDDPPVENMIHLSLDPDSPVLEKVEITPDLAPTFMSGFSARMKIVKELRWIHLEDQEDVAALARTLPNLTKLSIYINSQSLSVQHLGVLEKVEECVLKGHDIQQPFDRVLTGYTVEEIEQLQGLSDRILDTLRNAVEPASFLKRLKKLKLDGGRAGLSDVGCRLALVKLANLTCLDLEECRPGPPGITFQVLGEMRRKFSIILPNMD